MDNGKVKMPEYEDPDDNESTHSLEGEFEGLDISTIQMNAIKKVIATTNEKLCRSIREKNPGNRFGYNDYMMYHYAFVMNVATIRDPKFFPRQPSIHDGLKP